MVFIFFRTNGYKIGFNYELQYIIFGFYLFVSD